MLHCPLGLFPVHVVAELRDDDRTGWVLALQSGGPLSELFDEMLGANKGLMAQRGDEDSLHPWAEQDRSRQLRSSCPQIDHHRAGADSGGECCECFREEVGVAARREHFRDQANDKPD